MSRNNIGIQITLTQTVHCMYTVVIEFLPASNVIEGMNEYFITPDILSSKLFDLMIHELVMAFFTQQLM